MPDGGSHNAFGSAFDAIKSVDPYFDALCRTYNSLTARIDLLRQQKSASAEAVETLDRRRQGILDTILMIVDCWDVQNRLEPTGSADSTVAPSTSGYIQRLIDRTLESGTPTTHDFPLLALKAKEDSQADSFWNYVLTLSRREINIEIRANPKTMRRLIAGPEFMKPYLGAVTGRYAGDLEEEVIQFHLSPCVSGIRLPARGGQANLSLS